MNKHILVISQYFFPEQFRINDICEEWIERGYKVTVVTGIPNYPEGKFYEGYGFNKKNKESYKGIDIIRLPLVPRGNHAIMLFLNYISFVISGFIWSLTTNIKADQTFIFEVSPMTQALPGVWYSKRNNIPCFLYVQDLWPENVEIITGIKSKIILNSIGKMVDYIYRNCNKIFTTSKSFKASINKRGISDTKITYWPQYAENFYCMLEKSEKEDKKLFNIVFAGNIGNAQGLEILPKAAMIIKKITKNENLSKPIRFNIIGDGRFKETLIKIVEDNNLMDMFNFIEKKPAQKIPQYMSENDVAFLCLTESPLFKMTIPAKLQSYMACGIPVLASAGGETSKIIEEANAGLSTTPGNEEELANAILKLSKFSDEEIATLGHNAKNYSTIHFNKQSLMDQMDKYLKNEIGGNQNV